jgi:tripartite-type tricarboxylate transporter receptor subunit TctC
MSLPSGPSLLLAVVMTGVVSAAALSETQYPAGPVKIVVPFAPGGTTDVIARILAQGLSEELGQQFYIENRGGAGGMLGVDLVAKASPDGQTMLVYHIGLVYGPGLYKQLPYDVEKDFAPVTLLGLAPSIHIVNRDLPIHSVADFIALAKAKPGELNYGSAGVGSSAHLGVELFQMTAGVKVTQVPFRGGGPAVMGVISGHVQFMIETAGGLMPHIQSGSVRTLAVTGEHRMAELPDVPTMREAGLKDYVYTTWYALWLPARTPAAIVTRLNGAAAKVLAIPASKAALAKAGVEATSTSPERMTEIVHSDLGKWTKIIREANITPQ